MMLTCADKLQDSALVDYFVQNSGQALYKENLQNMARYPPQYGLASNQSNETKVAGSADKALTEKPD